MPSASARARNSGLGDRVEDDAGGGASDRVAAERPAETARAGRVHDLGPAGDRRQRQAPAQRLPGNEQIGRNAAVLDCPHRPRPPHARLHLVCDEENPVRVADLAEMRQVIAGHRDEAALALHGLEHDARDRLRLDLALEQVLERCDRGVRVDAAVRIRSGGAVDLPGEGTEPRLVGAHLARHRHRQERPPVEAVLEDDDRGPAGRGARDLDGVLDRLCAGVDEDRLLALAGAGRVLGEPPADLDVRLVGADHEALVQEAVDLLVDRGDDRREAVARVLAGDPAREVQIDGAVRRLDLRPLGACDHEARGRNAARDEALACFEDVVGRRALAERHAAIVSRRLREVQWTGGRTAVLRSSTLCRKGTLAASVHTA